MAGFMKIPGTELILFFNYRKDYKKNKTELNSGILIPKKVKPIAKLVFTKWNFNEE